VRRHDHLFQLQQLVIGRRWFLGKNVECCARNLTTRERFVKRVFVDQATTSAVDNPCTLFHLADRFAIDEAACLGS
jgi:hypothetical protein